MKIFKTKKQRSEEEREKLLRESRELLEQLRDPNSKFNKPYNPSYEEQVSMNAYRRKLDRRYERMDTFFTTIRDILLTPLAPIFSILALVSKVAMYGGALTFLFACYKVYKSVADGTGIFKGIVNEWYFFALPFIAAFLYFIFDSVSEYCSEHSLY